MLISSLVHQVCALLLQEPHADVVLLQRSLFIAIYHRFRFNLAGIANHSASFR